MITSRSRYVDGDIVPESDGEVAVYRNFPPLVSEAEQILHIWKQSDRLDRLASRYMGSPLYWWKIMDINPMIQSPNDLRPGMQVRIPHRV